MTRGYRGLQWIIEAIFSLERSQILFLSLFCIKVNAEEISSFSPKPWTNPLQKCQFCAFLKPIFLLFRNACLLYKTSKIVFSRFIFTIFEMGKQGVTRGLQGVTSGYKRGYKGLQGVTMGEKG